QGLGLPFFGSPPAALSLPKPTKAAQLCHIQGRATRWHGFRNQWRYQSQQISERPMNAPAQVITPVSPPTSPAPAPYWGARLRIGITRSGQRSILGEVAHEGPLRIQRPFYPEGVELCHLYLLHPPGGLVSGDHLQIDARVESDAGALITTPSAGKVYRANAQGTPQVQQTRLEVAAGASLEWLPQENILFGQAAAVLETEIHLQPSARMIAWELVCLGRPHCNGRFESGY